MDLDFNLIAKYLQILEDARSGKISTEALRGPEFSDILSKLPALIKEVSLQEERQNGIHIEVIADSEKYQKQLDKLFTVEAGMEEYGPGLFKGGEEAFASSFHLIHDIFSKKHLRKHIVVFNRWVGGEKEDILEFYKNREENSKFAIVESDE